MVFAGVATPRMSIDTFPELTPPVLVVGTLAPGLGPKDVEKTLTWRIEKYVSATPGVDHVESISRNNLSIVYVWLKWGTDLNSAQTLVQQQTAVRHGGGTEVAWACFRPSSSSTTLPTPRWSRSPSPAVASPGPQLYDYAFNNIEPLLEGIPGVASAAINGGRQRQINVVVDPAEGPGAGRHRRGRRGRGRAVERAAAFRRVHLARVRRQRLHQRRPAARWQTIGDAMVKLVDGKPVLIRDVARVEDGGTPGDADGLGQRTERRLPQRAARPGRQHPRRSSTRSRRRWPPARPAARACRSRRSSTSRPSCAPPTTGLKKEVVQALVLIALVILLFLQSVRGTLIVSVAIPLSFAITLIVLYAHRADAQRLHARRPDAGHGAAGRRRGGRARVHPPPPADGHERRTQAALHGTNAVALPGARLHADHDGRAAPGPAARRPREEALRAARADRRRRHDRLVLREHVRDARGVPVLPRPRRAPGALAKRGRARHRPASPTATPSSSAACSRSALVSSGIAAVLVVAAVWAATRLPSTLLPGDRRVRWSAIYVRLAPGTLARGRVRQITRDGRRCSPNELPKGGRRAGAHQRRLAGQRPQRDDQPERGPAHGVHPARARRIRRSASSRQREIADRIREILGQATTRAWSSCSGRAASSPSVFSNGYIAPLVVEVRGENLERARRASARQSPRWRATVPGRARRPGVAADRLPGGPRRHRPRGGRAGRRERARTVAQTTLEATLGNINTPSVWIDPNNGQSYYVVTYYDGARRRRTRTRWCSSPCASIAMAKPVTLGAYGNIRRSVGPVAIERNQLERAAHVLMQTEGRDIGSAADELEQRSARTRAPANLTVDFVGQVDLMRDTFSGLGLAIGLAVMVVFMIMASQFKSLRLPFVMLFTIPVSLVGIVLALHGGGPGFLHHGADGHPDGDRHRRLQRHPAGRRRQPPLSQEGTEKSRRSRGGPLALRAHRHDQPGHRHRPHPHGAGRSSTGPSPTSRWRWRWSAASPRRRVLSLFLVPVMFVLFARREARADEEPADGGGGVRPLLGPGLQPGHASVTRSVAPQPDRDPDALHRAVVFAGVATPRMAVDTFPELTPPVLVVGTLAPGLGPKDVEKTITWRIEKYVSATPGVDHVESISRNNLSIIYVWLKWGTDLNAAQTLVQQQTAVRDGGGAEVARRASAVRPAVRPVERARWSRSPSAGRRASRARSSTTTRSTTSSRCSRASPASPARRSTAAASGRSTSSSIRPRRRRAGVTASDIAAAVAQSNALLPSGEFISPKLRRQRLHQRRPASGSRPSATRW